MNAFPDGSPDKGEGEREKLQDDILSLHISACKKGLQFLIEITHSDFYLIMAQSQPAGAYTGFLPCIARGRWSGIPDHRLPLQ